MSKKHTLYDDILGDLDGPVAQPRAEGSRFLKRSTSIADRMSGEVEEKTLRWVDPLDCVMWNRHNRAYDLLNEENCRDLIDGIRSQGRQEFPAIVRQKNDRFEVICGARRHFAVSWLRRNNYPQFRYLIEVRDLTDEEAFRLADIENRDREDISDFERAVDYADAIDRYYGGKQKAMAARLEVSPPWLSRYLQLAKLPHEIVHAFASVRDLKERHARELKPLMADFESAERLKAAALELARLHKIGQGGLDGAAVMKRLKAAAVPRVAKPRASGREFRRAPGERGITMRQKGRKVVMEFDANLSSDSLRAAFENYLKDR